LLQSRCFSTPWKELQKTSVTQMLAKLFFFSRTSSCGTLRFLQTLKVLLQKTFVTQTAESFSRTTSCWPSRLLQTFGRCYFTKLLSQGLQQALAEPAAAAITALADKLLEGVDVAGPVCRVHTDHGVQGGDCRSKQHVHKVSLSS
jgi:hypothetical protein